MEWTERAKLLVGKTPSGTFCPFTTRVLDGSVWQSRQSELASLATALVAADADVVSARSAKRQSHFLPIATRNGNRLCAAGAIFFPTGCIGSFNVYCCRLRCAKNPCRCVTF